MPFGKPVMASMKAPDLDCFRAVKEIFGELYIKHNLMFLGTAMVNGKLHISEIINNILIFVPVGIYTCMLKQDWSITKKISVAFFISLAVEVLQFVLAIGATDITDLMGNTLGEVIGIGAFYLFIKVLKNKAINILNILASISTVGLVSLISILLLAN